MLQRGQSSSHKNELCQSLCCSFSVGSVSFGLSPKIVHDISNFRCAAGDEVARKPKLFYVSTSAQTTTLSTASVCYVTSGTPTTCTGRRRRSIDKDGAQLAVVKPSQLNQEVQPSQYERKLDREGRFLLYWITTTSISTSTSYTTTISVSAIECTTSGQSLCG